jgi:hypothetical protein
LSGEKGTAVSRTTGVDVRITPGSNRESEADVARLFAPGGNYGGGATSLLEGTDAILSLQIILWRHPYGRT